VLGFVASTGEKSAGLGLRRELKVVDLEMEGGTGDGFGVGKEEVYKKSRCKSAPGGRITLFTCSVRFFSLSECTYLRHYYLPPLWQRLRTLRHLRLRVLECLGCLGCLGCQKRLVFISLRLGHRLLVVVRMTLPLARTTEQTTANSTTPPSV